ncbi:MAG: hypothetical protein KJP25_10020 [Gammaproteobacteria bacterium]|nr:hypothetical protein [Gammaproteobacteria bacterium]MBT8150470.1 hypothetical protein [Gammaproteobacteria bacterium]NND39731.1 hypothetical protein [Pseudomonadales bacterium]NNL11889.1 hypothetical protein [Pseudomonadales bacterium]
MNEIYAASAGKRQIKPIDSKIHLSQLWFSTDYALNLRHISGVGRQSRFIRAG